MISGHLRGRDPIEHLLVLPSHRSSGNAGDSNLSQQRYPLLVFLHGAGEVDTSLDYLGSAEGATGALPQLALLTPKSCDAQPADDPFPWLSAFAPHLQEQFAVLAPLSRRSWSNEGDCQATLALIEDVVASFPIDPDRVIITGVSQGGYGALRIAQSNPSRFAGVAPVCGFGDKAWPATLASKNVPAFFSHGVNDRIVPVSASDGLVAAFKAKLAPVDMDRLLTYKRLAESADPIGYPGTGHAAWRNVYTDAAFWRWACSVVRS
jgi:predicted peptidase